MSRIKYPLEKLSIDFTVDDVMSAFRLNKPRAMKLIKYWINKKYVSQNGENYIKLQQANPKVEEVAKQNIIDTTETKPVNSIVEGEEKPVIDVELPTVDLTDIKSDTKIDKPVADLTDLKSKKDENLNQSKDEHDDIIHEHDVLYRVTLTNSTTMELKAKSIATAMESVTRMGYPSRAIFKIEEI